MSDAKTIPPVKDSPRDEKPTVRYLMANLAPRTDTDGAPDGLSGRRHRACSFVGKPSAFAETAALSCFPPALSMPLEGGR
jgi:hypothetical protein